MARRATVFGWAQRPRRGLWAITLIVMGCSNSGAGRGRGPVDPGDRPTGCIDTPFVGPDNRTSTLGVVCGREPTPAAMLLRGRVVVETPSGLPGPGLEGVWVSVHPIMGPVQLAHLPAARAQVQTSPQGAFAVSLHPDSARTATEEELLIVVRRVPEGPVIAAQRIVGYIAGPTPEVLLQVPASALESPR